MAESRINLAALQELERSPEMRAALGRFGAGVARRAAVNAPKRTGAGAKSIDHEVGYDARGLWVRISWDRPHFYMSFHELGTSEITARPFLRPALYAQDTV